MKGTVEMSPWRKISRGFLRNVAIGVLIAAAAEQDASVAATPAVL